MRLAMTSAGAVGFALMLSTLWLLRSAGHVHACSCVDPHPPSEALERAAAVFAGRVVSVREFSDPSQGGVWSTADPTTVGFKVSAVWKGPAYETMYVATPRSGMSCGFTFVEGKEYIVYAQHTALGGEDSVFELLNKHAVDGYTVSLCSRTALLQQAEADQDALGMSRTPATDTGGQVPKTQEIRSVAALWLVILAVASTVLATGGMVAYARVRRR
ncbi:MAG: hypothetical protein F4X98_17160 [Gammaproteobacteria bacterium]|nr:hypothetical protein [Gammaproteobacteria bacterium]